MHPNTCNAFIFFIGCDKCSDIYSQLIIVQLLVTRLLLVIRYNS